MEIWIYRDGTQMFAGPVVGGDIQGTVLTLNAQGLLFYLNYMLVTADKTWTGIDQFVIAKEVIDDWQVLTYGDYGLSTVGVWANRVANFAPWGYLGPLRGCQWQMWYTNWVLPTMAFDTHVDPGLRTVDLYSPTKGVDRTSTVFLERGIESADIRFSVAPGIIASEVYLTGTSEASSAITSTQTDAGLRATFGRGGVAGTVDNVSEQAMLDDLAQAWVDARGTQFFQPGAGLLPVAGARYEDFDPGDTVTYAYDEGLGDQTGSYRVVKRSVEVGDSGTEKFSVEFE